MAINNKNNIGDKQRKISGKKMMLVTALLSGGVVIRVNHHINHSFGNPSREVINFDLTLESTEVLISDDGVFYVGQGTPIDNFDIADFVTILDESGNVIPKSEVTLEWDIKEYFEGNTFGKTGEYLITITASTTDGRTGELEYKLVVKEGHIFAEIKPIEEIEVDVNNEKELLDFQEYFRVLNSVTGTDTGAEIKSTLEDEDLQSVGSTQVIFYTELDGIKFTNSVHISVVDTIAPRIDLAESYEKDGVKWNKEDQSITISELDKTIGDFSLDQYATAYDASGDYELSWDFDEVMEGKLGEITSNEITIKAIDGSGNETTTKVYVDVSTVSIEFKDGISKVAFELFHTPDLNDPMNQVSAFYDVLDAAGNPVVDDRISWDLTKEMLSTIGEYRLTIEVLDENRNELIGTKGVTIEVKDTIAPEVKLVSGVKTTFDIEVDQFNSIDNIYMYLEGITNIDDLVTVTDNSGVWGYRLEYNNQELTDDIFKTVGVKGITLKVFDYDINGEESNYSYLNDANGQPLSIVLNIVDTQKASVVVTDEVINLEVMQNATKEMIEISKYAEITDNSGSFTWDLRVKGSPEDVMDYEDMFGKITPLQGIEIELIVRDESGNVSYADMLLIVTDTEAPSFEIRKTEETININPSASEINEYRQIENYVRVTDNSKYFDVDWDFDQVVRQATEAGVYYVTVTAIDGAGNVSEETITFTVVDNEAPVIIVNTKTIEIEANEYTNKDELEFDINLKDYITVTDNSNGLIDTMFDYSSVDFGAIGTYEVIITATDAAGNESINIIELKVIAGEPKVRVVNDKEIIDNVHIDSSNTISGIKIVTQGGKILIERTTDTNDQADILTHLTMENLLEFLTINGETIESQTWDLSTIDFSTIGTYDIQLTVTNNFGKTATETIEFVVIQEYDSILELKGDNFIDLEIDASDTNRDVSWFESTYDENDYAKFIASGGSGTFLWDQSTLTNIDFDRVGSYVVTIYLDDGHADRKELTLSLNIIDTKGPVFTTVNDMETAEVNDKDSNDYVFTDFVTVEDNSGIAPTLSWNLDTQVDFTKVGTYVVTIKAVDSYGNETTKDITFEINDTEAPVLVLNSGMDIQTIEINSRDASSFNINSFVTATDNSGIAPELEWNIQDVDFGTTGTYTIIIKAADSAKNESNEVTVTFEVEDTIAPSIDIDPVGLEELKVEINTKSESDYSDWLEDYVTVTDNSGESITPSWDITSVDFNTFGTYMVTITAVDASGNTTTQVVSFGVSDTTAPVITIKDDKEITTLEVFDGKLADFTLADFATCSDASTCTIEWDIQNVDFSTVGTYVVTIKAVDIYGNESRAEITIEVQDNTKPEIVITRPDILLSMGKFTSYDFSVYDFATVTDNYDNSVSLTWNIDDVDFNAEGDYTVTITAIDSNGNEAEEKTVEFRVEEINIILEEVSPFEIEVTQSPDAAAIDVGTYFKATQDNGSAVEGITWNLTDEMLKVYGTHGVTLKITFDGGKTIEMEVTLEVVDNSGPVITEIKNTETIELGNLTEYDNLAPSDFITIVDNSGGYTNTWNLDNVVNNTVADTYVVTITATDSAGNFTEHNVNIVVVDTTDPVLELNDDFDRNNMIWSKASKELSILAGDKTQAEIDLWELVTATDASTSGLTIDWDLTDLDNPLTHTVIITVEDASGNVATETITVVLLKPTPILNNFSVDRTYDEVSVDVDLSNLKQSVSDLTISLYDENGTLVGTAYNESQAIHGHFTIHHTFSNLLSNTEYKVVLEYTYATGANGNANTTITEEQTVNTLSYSQNDVLGTITDTYISHTDLIVNYELGNDKGLLTSAMLVILDSNGTVIPGESHTIDINNPTGSHTFTGLTPNTDYIIEIRLSYNFNDGTGGKDKISDIRSLSTLSFSEHDVITDITGITQSPSTISVDYNITDTYSLIIAGTMKARIYDANDMSEIGTGLDITSLSGTVQFTGLDANTSYIVVIEVELDLQDGSTVVKETGSHTTTEAYHFDEITVNINNVVVSYDDITFDYEVFDPNNLLVDNSSGYKLQVSINGDVFDLQNMSGNESLAAHKEILSGTVYDVQIHFIYDLKDGLGPITHDTNLYGFVESTRAYDLDQDLTLTSHNLASDMQTIYVDYSLRNLNLIGDMSTLSVTIRNKDTGDFEIIAFSALAGISLGQLEGSFELDSINGNDLIKETDYEITISIDYDLNDGNGIKTNLLLLENAQIQTKDVPLVGYNVISTIERGYTFLNVDFHIEDDLSHGTNLLNSFKIALLDENGIPVTNYDYITYPVSSGDNNIKFENLLSDATYTIVYRIDNPYYTSAVGEDEFIDITRKVTTRTYDTNLINVDYTLNQGLTFLHLEDIQVLNTNEVFENIDYSSVILVITYTTRDGQVITVERDLGALTEGTLTEALFTDIQSNTDVQIEFKLEHDLKDGEGIQAGTDEIIRTSDTKTLEYDFTFIIENDEVLVTGLTPGFTGDHLVIFEEVEGYTVKDIKADAFYGDNISFTELTIPRTLETIGQNAFRNVSLGTVNLTSVFEVIPTITTKSSSYSAQGILVIGDNAFRDNLIVGFDFTTTETIGMSAFRNNLLGTIVLGDSITNVGQEAFYDSGVVNLTLGELLGESSLGSDTFVANKIAVLTLGNIDIKHDSLGTSKDVFADAGFELEYLNTAQGDIENSSWKYNALNANDLNRPIQKLTIGEGVNNIGEYAFEGNQISVLSVGKNVENIGQYAFSSAGINTIDLGESIEIIGRNAFANNSISELLIPDTTSYIDTNAFINNSMDKLTIGELLSDENFGSNTFVGNNISDLEIGNIGFRHNSLGSSKQVLNNSGYNLIIADSAVGIIDHNAWRYVDVDPVYSNVKIINLTIGNGIEEIGNLSFMGNSLNEVSIGDSVEKIGENTFNNTGITKLTLGKSLEFIGISAFIDNQIKEISFPESLKEIRYNAFTNNEIEELVIPNSVEEIGSSAFANNKITKLTVGELLSDENFGIETFVGNKISDLTIGNIGFKHNSLGASGDVFASTGISLTFANTAKGEIAGTSWRYVPNNPAYLNVPITNLNIGDGVTKIGMQAFMGNQLNHVAIGDGVESIEDFAFTSTQISTLDLGENIKEIKWQAFRDNNITELVIPDSVVSISADSFSDNNITKLSIGNGLVDSKIGSAAFDGNSIDDLTLSNTDLLQESFGTPSNVFDSTGINLVYDEKAVGAIPNNAWRYGTNYSSMKVNTLTLGDNISSIGTYAFDSNNIETLKIPSLVQTIGANAFNNSNISTVDLNDNLTTIGDNAFSNNNLTTVSIPDSVTSLGKYSFAKNSITSFNFIDNLTHISEGLLDGNSLTDLVLPQHIETVGSYAFRNNSIVNLTLSDKITEFNTSVFENNNLTSFVIEDTITSIGTSAFAGNTIGELVIPDTLQSIGANAFANNTTKNSVPGLKKVTIVDGVSASLFSAGNVFLGNDIEELIVGNTDFKHNTFGVSENVFNTTTGLSLTFTDNATGEIVDSAWEHTSASSTSNVQLNGIYIGNSITSIGDKAFLGNNLKKVVIGDAVTYVGTQSFASMGINDITLGNSITEIGKEAFMDNEIASFIFPNTLTKIGDGAFKSNVIKTLVLPNSVSSVGSNAFESNGMTTLTIGSLLSHDSFGTNSFIGNSISQLTIGHIGFKYNSLGTSSSVFASTGLKLIFADTASGKIEATAWRYVANDPSYLNVPIIDLSIGDGVTEIGIQAFMGNSLNEVVIGNSVTLIDEFSFASTKINKLDLGESVESIKWQAFKDNLITELVIPDSTTEIGTDAFADNDITKLSIGSGMVDSKYGTSPFSGNSINDLTLSNADTRHDSLGTATAVFNSSGFNLTYTDKAVGSIPDNAWRFNSSNSGVKVIGLNLGNGVSGIGVYAFGSTDLKTLTLGSGVRSIDNDAFSSANISTLTMNEGLVTLGNNAFSNNLLTTAALPDSVTTLGDYAFSGNKLTSFDFNTNVTAISKGMFDNNSFVNVTIPDHIDTIGTFAYRNNDIVNLVLNEKVSVLGESVFENNDITGVDIKPSVTTIGFRAFANNNINELKIPDTVTSLALQSFMDNAMSKLELGKNMTDTHLKTKTAFKGNSITDLTLNNGDFNHTTLGVSSDVFNSSGFNLTYTDQAEGEIPKYAWTHIKNNASYSQVPVLDLYIGDKITAIGDNAFQQNSLGTVVIGDGVKIIASTAFSTTTMTSLTFGNSVESIGFTGFVNNYNITEIVLPASIKSISGAAFNGCTNLKKVTFLGGTVISSSSFGSNPTFYNASGQVIR